MNKQEALDKIDTLEEDVLELKEFVQSCDQAEDIWYEEEAVIITNKYVDTTHEKVIDFLNSFKKGMLCQVSVRDDGEYIIETCTSQGFNCDESLLVSEE